ncbi:hypothetical protein BGZ73_004738 [Actinomortierella ambigua]|nr:hypothetical protein BGZ73_004738 [Actinomortierella ambigua]
MTLGVAITLVAGSTFASTSIVYADESSRDNGNGRRRTSLYDDYNDDTRRSYAAENRYTQPNPPGTAPAQADMTSQEELMPGLVYVALAGLTGSFVVRQRNIFVRMFSPVAFATAAGAYCLPDHTHRLLGGIGYSTDCPECRKYGSASNHHMHSTRSARPSATTTASGIATTGAIDRGSAAASELSARAREAWSRAQDNGQTHHETLRMEADRAQGWVNQKRDQVREAIDDVADDVEHAGRKARGWIESKEGELDRKADDARRWWGEKSREAERTMEDARQKAADTLSDAREEVKETFDGARRWASYKAREIEQTTARSEILKNKSHDRWFSVTRDDMEKSVNGVKKEVKEATDEAKRWFSTATSDAGKSMDKIRRDVEDAVEGAGQEAQHWWNRTTSRAQRATDEASKDVQNMYDRTTEVADEMVDKTTDQVKEASSWVRAKVDEADQSIGDAARKAKRWVDVHVAEADKNLDALKDSVTGTSEKTHWWERRRAPVGAAVAGGAASGAAVYIYSNEPEYWSDGTEMGTARIRDDETDYHYDGTKYPTRDSSTGQAGTGDAGVGHPHQQMLPHMEVETSLDGSDFMDHYIPASTPEGTLRPGKKLIHSHLDLPHVEPDTTLDGSDLMDHWVPDDDVAAAPGIEGNRGRLTKPIHSHIELPHLEPDTTLDGSDLMDHWVPDDDTPTHGREDTRGSLNPPGSQDAEGTQGISHAKRKLFHNHLNLPHVEPDTTLDGSDLMDHWVPDEDKEQVETPLAPAADAAVGSGRREDASRTKADYWTLNGEEMGTANIRGPDYYDWNGSFADSSLQRASWWQTAWTRHLDDEIVNLKERAERFLWDEKEAAERVAQDIAAKLAAEQERLEATAAEARARADAAARYAREQSEALLRERQAAVERAHRDLEQRLAQEREEADRRAAEAKARAAAYEAEQRALLELEAEDIRNRVEHEREAADAAAASLKAKAEAWAKDKQAEAKQTLREVHDKALREAALAERAAHDAKAALENKLEEEKLRLQRAERELAERIRLDKIREDHILAELKAKAEALGREEQARRDKTAKEFADKAARERAEAQAQARAAATELENKIARERAEREAKLRDLDRSTPSTGWRWPWSSSGAGKTETTTATTSQAGYDSTGQLLDHIKKDVQQTKEDVASGLGHLHDHIRDSEARRTAHGMGEKAKQAVHDAGEKVKQVAHDIVVATEEAEQGMWTSVFGTPKSGTQSSPADAAQRAHVETAHAAKGSQSATGNLTAGTRPPATHGIHLSTQDRSTGQFSDVGASVDKYAAKAREDVHLRASALHTKADSETAEKARQNVYDAARKASVQQEKGYLRSEPHAGVGHAHSHDRPTGLLGHIREDIALTRDDIQSGVSHMKDTILGSETAEKIEKQANEAIDAADRKIGSHLVEAHKVVDEAAEEGRRWWKGVQKEAEQAAKDIDAEMTKAAEDGRRWWQDVKKDAHKKAKDLDTELSKTASEGRTWWQGVKKDTEKVAKDIDSELHRAGDKVRSRYGDWTERIRAEDEEFWSQVEQQQQHQQQQQQSDRRGGRGM